MPTAGPPEYFITVPATLSWVLLAEYDNRTNDGKITEKVQWKLEESVQRSEFEKTFNSTTRRQLQDQSITTDVGASWEGISANIKGNIQVSDEVTEVIERTTEVTVKTDWHKEQSYEREFVVAGGGYLAIWQQKFTSDGVNVMCQAVTTNPQTAKEVQQLEIVYTTRAVQFIKDIQVVYGSHMSDAPGVRVLETHGSSDDINHGYGGKYVWLVPQYTDDADEAATRFDLYIQEKSHSGWPDLAKGAGGSYRYLRAVADKNVKDKITDLHLERSNTDIKDFNNFDGHTGDINRGRALSYLYLTWNVRTAW